jgi:uncharacterized protein YdeI (YjbR/CyaY-like superfamily)
VADLLQELVVPSRAAWRRWLTKHHADPGVWVALAKKGVTTPTSLTYDEALLEALCFGWIDGQIRRGDERVYYQRFTPRRPRSRWSLRNTQLVDQLTEQGLMHPAGLAAAERAKADGSWESAYAGQRTMQLPDDLAEALRTHPKAQAQFDVLTAQNRYALLYRLSSVTGAAARRRRIEQYVSMLAEGRTLHPQRRTVD